MLLRNTEITLSASSSSVISQLSQEDFLIEGLFKFIQKNTYIPQFLAAISKDSSEVKALQAAIHQGDPDNAVFDHPDCYLHLLYLIKNKLIPFWHGITIYYHLSILMQFTSRQNLKSEDADLKLIRDVSVDKLAEQGKLTAAGEEYIKALCEKLREIDCQVKFEEVAEFVHQLSSSEKWLFKLPYKNVPWYASEGNYDSFASQVVTSNVPFIVKTKDISQNDIHFYWIPSASITNYILQKISPKPMLRQPIFGAVNAATLRQMHKNGIHPCSLYAPHVKSNLYKADSFRCGPIAIAWHDDAHTIWGSMLKPEEREYLFNQYLPQLDGLADSLKDVNPAAYNAALEAIRRTADLDLIARYLNRAETRLGSYIESRFVLYDIYNQIDNSDYKAQAVYLYYIYCMSCSAASSKFDHLVWRQNLLGYFNRDDNFLLNREKLENFLENEKHLSLPIQLMDRANLEYKLAVEPTVSADPVSHVLLTNSTTLDYQSAKTKYDFNDETVFYAIGLPIDIKEPFANMEIISSLRKNIPQEEYWHSFNGVPTLILFNSEFNANNYANSDRVGNIYEDKICKQSPVFKVKLAPGLAQVTTVEGKIVINNKYARSDRGESYGYRFSWALQLKPNEVMLLAGSMNVSIRYGKKLYPEVDMKNTNQKLFDSQNKSQFFQQRHLVDDDSPTCAARKMSRCQFPLFI